MKTHMTLTITVSGPAKCGKSRLHAVIHKALSDAVLMKHIALPDTIIFKEELTGKGGRQ